MERVVEVFKFEPFEETEECSVNISANIIECEEGGYVAEVVGCPGCITQGETLEEIKEFIKNAFIGWLAEAIADKTIPVNLLFGEDKINLCRVPTD